MSKKVLACDDEAFIFAMLDEVVVEEGFQLLTAETGDEALRLARTEKPELILMDIRMPERDEGIEALRRLKSDPATCDICVIMLTAMGQESDRQRAMALGAEDYILKPFSPRALKRAIHQVLDDMPPDNREPPVPKPISAEALRERLQGLTRELLARDRDLCLLYELGAKIGRLTDEEEIAPVVVSEIMDVLDADCGWIVLWDGETATVPEGSRLAIDERTVDEINRVVLQPCQALGKQNLIAHTLEGMGVAPGLDFPVRLLASSIVDGGTERGYLCLGRGPRRDIFIAPDLKLIDAVASVTAVELENVRLHREELEKQRLEDELARARQIQQWLLPRDYCCSGFIEAAGLSEPCHEIGGDYYDLFRLADGRCLLGIADVTGKGAPAALQASLIQGIVHGCSRHAMDLSTQMETLNQCVKCRSVLGCYPSALLATLDEDGELNYTNGGHLPPLCIRTDGRVEEWKEGGMLLGILEDAKYPLGTARLQPGDLVVLYSDGVTDAENLSGETYGLPRFLEWASQQAGRSPAETKESLLATILQFCEGQRQADDLTALIVRYQAACNVQGRGIT